MDDKLFKFESDEIKNHIRYEMKLYQKMEDSFDYIYNMLVKLKFNKNLKPDSVIKLEKLKWDEGKNYNWHAITCGRVVLILRVYGGHFTIFAKNTITHEIEGSNRTYDRSRYSAFTFFVNREKVPEDKKDFYLEHPFLDLDSVMPDLIKMIAEDKVHSLWNPCSFKRPEHCDVENVYTGEDVDNIDKLIFCAEELSNKHMELFAENDMLDIIKGLGDKIGKQFDSRHKVHEIVTEFSKQYTDPYYHGVGIAVIDEEGKKDFHDVYRLTRWYADDVEKLMKEFL